MKKIILIMIMGIMFLTFVAAEATNFTTGDMSKFNLVTMQLIMSLVVFGVPIILMLSLAYFLFVKGGSLFVNPIIAIFIVCLATFIWIIIMPSLISVILEIIWG